MSDELFTKEQREAIVAVARATVDKMLAESAPAEWIMGKVMAVEQSAVTGTIAMVSVDGDPEENTIPCPVVIPFAVQPGDRVTLAFSPPHQHLVVGFLRTEGAPAATGRSTSQNENTELLDLDVIDLEQGGITWDSIHRGWTIPSAGVYSASATIGFATGEFPT